MAVTKRSRERKRVAEESWGRVERGSEQVESVRRDEVEEDQEESETRDEEKKGATHWSGANWPVAVTMHFRRRNCLPRPQLRA